MKAEEIKKILGDSATAEQITAIESASETELKDAHSGVTNSTLTAVDASISELLEYKKRMGKKQLTLFRVVQRHTRTKQHPRRKPA